MRFDFNIHKYQWIFGINITYSKDVRAFYFEFAIWSIGFFKIIKEEE